MTPISELADDFLVRLYRFVHKDLDHAVSAYAGRVGLKRLPAGTETRMAAIGIERFRDRNGAKLTW